MSSIFGSREYWISNGKSFLIALTSFILTYAAGTLVPDLQREGLLALSGIVSVLVNSVQKAIRLSGEEKQ